MSNRGKIWTIEELTMLEKLYISGTPVEDLATKFGRTQSAIALRVAALMSRDFDAGMKTAAIAAKWGRPVEDVGVYIERLNARTRDRAATRDLAKIVAILASEIMNPGSVDTATKKYVLDYAAGVLAPPKSKLDKV